MSDTRLFWLFIQQSLGYGSNKVKDIVDKFGTGENFFKAGSEKWKESGLFSDKELNALSKFDLKRAEKLLAHCEARNYQIITFEDESYPVRLKNIYNPPALLFVKGRLPDVDNIVTISVVGTRSSSEYGRKVAYYFGKNLAELGAIVVSGGALGVDSIAQKGALDAFGKVVTVLGCGLDSSYLTRTEKLSKLNKLIVNSGALLTEYAPECSPFPRNFPLRNRILSGLSLGTLVVEADLKSGALITAKLALEQGRDVFAVPGNITSKRSRGTNKIIKEWAKPVTSVEDVLEEYSSICPKINVLKNNKPKRREYKSNKEKSIPKSKKKEISLEGVSEAAKKVYECLTDTPVSMDALLTKLNMDTQEFLQATTELELNSALNVGPNKTYSKL